MNEVPSLWRQEVWHALSVHLPIVTLLLSTVFCILWLVTNTSNQSFFKKSTVVMLIIGVIGAWISIYSGEFAYDMAVRKICDPQVLKDHMYWAYFAAYTYSGGLAALIIFEFFITKSLVKYLLILILIAGLGALLYSGHLGASLVYNQGAGTYRPSGDCSEFVE
jgi:uncharacterized membrane protein